MARSAVTYVCQQCGARSLKWAGKCDDCGAWNTLVEERKEAPSGPGNWSAGRRITFEQLQIDSQAAPRLACNQGSANLTLYLGAA